ncbi:signal peptide protein [Acinetobacter baumannii]|nr:signal peptide protein [Acinetobacter baumannii]
MTTLNYTVSFQKTVLASLIGLCLSQTSFALEELSDAGLSETTGEGIAILPQNAFMVFRGAGPNESVNQIITDRSKDTGYINYMPVGPLSVAAADTSGNGTVGPEDKAVGKADIFLYGLALSKSDGDANSRIANTATAAAISSWGTGANPWVFKVKTANNIPNFSTTDSGGYPVTYLSLEAPLYQPTIDGAAGADAYNLKLGLWTDVFVRNPNIVATTNGSLAQFQYGDSNGLIGTSIDTSRANRLRLQGILNGFSLNGSQISMFQTLGGATTAGGMSPFYNNTLGMSGLVRLNTGDSKNTSIVTENITSQTQTYATSANNGWQTVHAGANSTLSTSSSGDCGNSSTGSFSTSRGCRYYVENRTRTDTKTSSKTRSAFNDTSKVLRLSTRETSDSPNASNNLYTPALDATGAVAPKFADTEGLYLYNPNINLVLGNLYQPLILGSDGKNFSIEIARIANKPEIYKQIYTDYTGADATYKGSTCNVYSCASPTHSSIAIGTVYSPDNGKTLLADTSEGAIGVSFGRLISTGTQVSGTSAGSLVSLTNSVSGTTSVSMTEVRFKQRQQNTQTWNQTYSCGLFNSNCDYKTVGYLYQWEYNQGTGTWVITNPTAKPADAPKCSGALGCTSTSGSTPMYGTVSNRDWSNASIPWLTSRNAVVNDLIGSSNGTTGYVIPTANQAPALNNITPLNNLGSAVVDGLLIQHLKLTTKGL